MSENRSGAEVALVVGLVVAAIGALLTSEVLGSVPSALLAVALILGAIGWWFRHRLARLRLRSPLYIASPESPSVAVPVRPPLIDAERRRALKMMLLEMAGIGDQIAHYPPYRQEPWKGRLHDIIEDALGREDANTVTGWDRHAERLVALRTLIADIDKQELRDGFDPRDIPPGTI